MQAAPLESLNYQRFSELLGSRFQVELPNGTAAFFELSQVTGGRASAKSEASLADYENFSLFFLGPAEPIYPQATYRFEQEQLGAFDLFIVPLGREKELVLYQAVFNRMPCK